MVRAIYLVLLPLPQLMAVHLDVVSIVVLLVCPTAIYCSNVTVNPSSSSSCSQPCGSVVNGTSIDQALGNISSGDYLRLLPGCHCVRTFSVVKDVTNVSLIGDDGGVEIVQITCAPGLGLAFLNVTRLSFQRLTITGCGLNGSNAVSLNTAINTIVDLFIQLAEDINIALLIASCTNVVMDHVTIVNTNGIGLVGVNVAGQSNFTNNVFSSNAGQNCKSTNARQPSSNTAGGGAQLMYVDYINQSSSSSSPVYLNIDNNTFSQNSYCGIETYVEIFYQYYQAFRGVNYTVGAGGGLSFNLAQQGYPLFINVQRSSFKNNTATFGSAAAILWYAGLQDTHITFSDCDFSKNGFAQYSQSTLGLLTYSVQGGVLVLKDIVVRSRPWPSNLSHPNTLVFLRSKFVSNSGLLGSGILIKSQYSVIPINADSIVMDSCQFEENTAMAGSALYISENKFTGLQMGLTVTIQNCTFLNNIVSRSAVGAPSGVLATVQASLMNITIRDSSFLGNTGTAVGGISSLIILEGDVRFHGNTALAGGALSLVSASTAIVKRNSIISFANNTASISGGAIYGDYFYGQSSLGGGSYDCFLQFDSIYIFCNIEYPCPDLTTFNITMTFSNNTATLGGSLYGSTLESCSWATQIKRLLNLNGSILELVFNKGIIFHSPQSPNSSHVLSTPVSTLAAKNTSSLTYMPGQMFELNLNSTDSFNQKVPTIVTAQPLSVTVGDSGYWLTSASDVGTKVYGQQNATVNIILYSVDRFVQSNSILVTLTECKFGFYYNDTKPNCLCQNATVNSQVTCDQNLKVFNITYGQWFGPEPGASTGVVFQACLFDYCLPRDNTNLVITVLPQAIDAQCGNNRRGLLCGGCQEGYSAVFGTNRCMKCSDNTLGLLVFCAAVGVGIIAVITLLHISISEGYINGPLFYASVVSTYEIHFTGHFSAREIFIPVYLLNLDMGFETCFYNGMTPLERIGLGLLFPAYLFVLMILFIWLTSRSLKLSEWLAKSNYTPSKLVATLIVLSYNSITQSCIQIIGFVEVTVYRDDGSRYVISRWATDPNVEYFSPIHALLFVITVVLVAIFVIPVPFLLILPSLTSRVVWGLKPLYDAFVCHYKDRYAFWLGMRLFLRLAIFMLSSFLQPPTNILLLGICVSLIVFASSVAHPFKLASQGALDSFFLSNILLLVTGSLYFRMLEGSSANSNRAERVFFVVVVCSAYVVMLGILVWHLVLRFPKLLVLVPSKCVPKGHRHSVGPQVDSLGYGVLQDNHVQYRPDEELDASIDQPRFRVQNFSEYREPLLGGGSVSLNREGTRR